MRETFTTFDEKGREIVCDVLFTFDWDKTKESYIVYTDNSEDEEGNTQVYASILKENEGRLKPLQTEAEWEIIEAILHLLQERIRSGEGIDIQEITQEINRML